MSLILSRFSEKVVYKIFEKECTDAIFPRIGKGGLTTLNYALELKGKDVLKNFLLL